MAEHGIRLPAESRKSAWKKRYFLYIMAFPNGQQYIGVTYNEWTRFTQHLSRARKGSNQPIHQAIRELGEPKFDVLCIGSRDYIAELEGKAITAFRSELNMLIGTKHSTETKARMSAAAMGRKPWNKGVKRTPEERAAIKAGLDKSERTTGARGKLAVLNKERAGQPLSPEHREAVRASLKGRTMTPEWRAKMAEARRRWWERKRSVPHF